MASSVRPETLDQLTDKEKQVLRLLARGHDAKSTANSLSLSVHTINERLRAARRKLNVTSSREAARLLLEIEQAEPKKLGSKILGDAPNRFSTDPEPAAADTRREKFWIGGIVMTTFFALAAVLLSSTNSMDDRSVSDSSAVTEDAELKEYDRAAREWLALVDEYDWVESFAAAGQSFQKPNTVATWREASKLARVPLGAVVSRTTWTADFVAAPPKGYVVVVFKTDFAERPGAFERVTLEKEEDGWKAVAYVID
ncbi:MAG: DUF4019 domain-containing protein [Pseudomonadota bacterium]